MTQPKILFPYRTCSEGAKLLRNQLKCKFLKRRTSAPYPRKRVINWGSSRYPLRNSFSRCLGWWNNPLSVLNASNKLATFFLLKNRVNIPEFTTESSEALEWLPTPIVCRQKLRGHSGQGIVIAEKEEEVVEAPLYTKYIKKTRECRIHVFCGKIILVQEKKRKKDVPDNEVNWRIRNNGNGFVFAKFVKPIHPDGLRQALMAIKALNLDFGAVDIIYNKAEDKWYVLEINTAPGLSPETAKIYANAITRELNK